MIDKISLKAYNLAMETNHAGWVLDEIIYANNRGVSSVEIGPLRQSWLMVNADATGRVVFFDPQKQEYITAPEYVSLAIVRSDPDRLVIKEVHYYNGMEKFHLTPFSLFVRDNTIMVTGEFFDGKCETRPLDPSYRMVEASKSGETDFLAPRKKS